jgi:hypothetical protein
MYEGDEAGAAGAEAATAGATADAGGGSDDDVIDAEFEKKE